MRVARAGTIRRGSTQAVSFADDDRVANLTLTVTPGPHVSVVFTGDPLPGDTRAELVPIEREGSADEDLLEDSSNRIEEYLRAQGYRDARAPHTRQEKDGELLITFDGATRSAVPRRRRGDLRRTRRCRWPDFESELRTRVGEPFSDANLDADVTALEGVYRGRGFVAARVQADPGLGRRRPMAQIPVAVSILITEGVRTVVGAVQLRGQHLDSRSGRCVRRSACSPARRTSTRSCGAIPTPFSWHTQTAATGRRPCRRSLASRRIARRRISSSPFARGRRSSSITC